MGHLAIVLFQFLRRNLLLFIFIVLCLASVPWIQREWEHIQRIVDELPALQGAEKHVSERQVALVGAFGQHVRQLSGAPVRKLDAEIHAIDEDIRRLEREKVSILFAPVKGADSVAARLQKEAIRRVEIDLRYQARDYLVALRARAVVAGDRDAAVRKREQLRHVHLKAYQAYQLSRAQLAQVRRDAVWLGRIPYTAQYLRLKKLEKAEEVLLAANNRAYRNFLAQSNLIKGLPNPNALSAFQVDQKRLASATAVLRDRLQQAENLAAQNHVWQAYLAVRPVLPAALGVLLGWWLIPAAIRTGFYFVLAPLAARRPPIVIRKSDGNVVAAPLLNKTLGGDRSRISAVSQLVRLASEDEMLIRPDYCQSQPAGILVTTKLLFNWHHWLTSIAAHLWMLKRLRVTQEAEIVVSSTVDALDEIALVEIAPGESFVLQPRGLVGMVYKAGQRPTIRSHWRIGTMHAWLTFQLRYLAFEGPATLIVKGCRGVRLESAAASRAISQEATLGFSANAHYAIVRAEPFLPYLRGTQPLFYDKFDGHNACYLYEEVPRNAREDRQQHNPLQMLADATMKAFGI
ncbi:hypothetical protein [Massilia soli]|uniref:Uncharacterized protein n=1 Tax=Massilia soli TaxID=2792854 RepID=A0ABS7SU10_9BURK|nr:hypothetical protein [Massilia soli]MBZ2209448.1 hypothetical protein [Massilia soli]